MLFLQKIFKSNRMIANDTFSELKSVIEKDIVKVDVSYIDFERNIQNGIIEVHNLVEEEVFNIFEDIKNSGFIISKIRTMDNYNFSDRESVIDNNTSCYNFRVVNGTTNLSAHAIGLAIDINPSLNPWVHPNGFNLFTYDDSIEGTILKNSVIVEIFKNYGWKWGGDWKHPDYQHFFKIGDEAEIIKNYYNSYLK